MQLNDFKSILVENTVCTVLKTVFHKVDHQEQYLLVLPDLGARLGEVEEAADFVAKAI